MRAVLDTNVFVSAFINGNSIPSVVVRRGKERVYELILSPALLAEYQRVLSYPHIQRLHRLSAQEIEKSITAFKAAELLVDPGVPERIVVADPDDDMFIACAVAGQADYIVSGDRHLLNIGEYQGIRIVRPVVFPSLLDAEQGYR